MLACYLKKTMKLERPHVFRGGLWADQLCCCSAEGLLNFNCVIFPFWWDFRIVSWSGVCLLLHVRGVSFVEGLYIFPSSPPSIMAKQIVLCPWKDESVFFAQNWVWHNDVKVCFDVSKKNNRKKRTWTNSWLCEFHLAQVHWIFQKCVVMATRPQKNFLTYSGSRFYTWSCLPTPPTRCGHSSWERKTQMSGQDIWRNTHTHQIRNLQCIGCSQRTVCVDQNATMRVFTPVLWGLPLRVSGVKWLQAFRSRCSVPFGGRVLLCMSRALLKSAGIYPDVPAD